MKANGIHKQRSSKPASSTDTDLDIIMKSSRSFPNSSFYKLALWVLVMPATQAVALNQPPIASAGIDQRVGLLKLVTLDGRRSVDKDGSIKKYQWREVVANKISADLKLPPTITLIRPLTVRPTFTSPAKPSILYFKLEVTDQGGAKASDVVTINIAATLNDTGITACGNATRNNIVCPVAGYPGQDGQLGRDITDNNNADGHAGFNFTKISSTGAVLPASATGWNCVKDNVTGLVWEVKTNDGGLHDKKWTYSWYEPDNTKNGGLAGTASGGICDGTSVCDTNAYVKAVNAVGWCGAKDWRMPTVDELFSIVAMDRDNPSIDTQYFSNTENTVFLSASPVAYYRSGVWGIDFSSGNASAYMYEKEDRFGHVWLVRSSGQ